MNQSHDESPQADPETLEVLRAVEESARQADSGMAVEARAEIQLLIEQLDLQ